MGIFWALDQSSYKITLTTWILSIIPISNNSNDTELTSLKVGKASLTKRDVLTQNYDLC